MDMNVAAGSIAKIIKFITRTIPSKLEWTIGVVLKL